MLEAANADLVSPISLKRSTQNLRLSTSRPADYPIFWHKADIEHGHLMSAIGGIADMAKAAAMSEADISRRFMLAARSESQLYQNILLEPV